MSTNSVYTMTIELRSDMCCGTGEANGVSVDQVTALDAYGLPFIPAKRLKGLLREEAEFIGDAGLVDALFGKSGASLAGRLSFSEARLVGYEQIVGKIQASKGAITPGMATGVYTVSRTGTRVGDDGVAADHTLRTIQFVRRCDTAGVPTRFAGRVYCADATEEDKALVDNAVRCLRAIGLGKSRGMGEVSCSGAWADERESRPEGVPSDAAATRVGYRVTLDAPAAVQSGTGENLDYIPGSVMQGVFAWLFCKSDPDFLERHILRDTRFLNAYVDVGGPSASAPVPFSYRTQKNAKGTVDAGTGLSRYPLYDMADERQRTEAQQVSINGYGAVVDGEYVVAEVAQSLSFHSSNQNSPQGKYYSIQSIDAGQSFSGAVIAAPEAIQRLKEAAAGNGGTLRIGTAKGSGFGACRLSFFDAQDVGCVEVRPNDRVMIRLVSDVVFIDEDGTNSADTAAFVKHLSQSGVLGFEFHTGMDASNRSCKAFVKTCVVGGYNAYWRLPKRQYVAFQKGSVIVVTVTSCDKGEVPCEAWTGLLQTEGFGQLAVCKVGESAPRTEYIKRDLRREPWPAPQCAAGQDGTPSQEDIRALASFEHDLALLGALDDAMLKACELGNKFNLESVSKSSFMRIGSILASACKTAEASGDTPLSEAFLTLAKDNFQEDEKTLFGECNKLVDSHVGDPSKYGQLSASGRNLVFRRFVLEYLHQVKVRYTTKKGGRS